MSEERETRLFMISPGSMLTPDQLVRMIHSFGMEVTVKETCYGCLVEAPAATVREVLSKVRERYPNEVFSKIRAYRCSDPVRCRARRSGRCSRGYSTASKRSGRARNTRRPKRRNAFP